MSGHKRATISITEEEYQRLLDAEVKLRAQPRLPQVVQETVVIHSHDVFDEYVQQTNQRQDAFEHVLDGFEDGIRGIQSLTSQALTEQQNWFNASMQQGLGGLGQQFSNLLQQTQIHFQNQVEEVNQRATEQVRRINHQLNDLRLDEQRKYDYAVQWYKAVVDMAQFITNNHHPDFFLPGWMPQIYQQIQIADGNLESGFYEAAMPVCQQVFLTLNQMYVKLEQAEAEWQLLHQALVEEHQLMMAEFEANRELTAVDIDGTPMEFALDTDYWSGGKYSTLFQHYAETIHRLGTDALPETIEQDQYLLDTWLPKIQQNLDQICFDARIAAANSQLRINIADLVVQALVGQGFHAEFDQCDFAQGDLRSTYRAELATNGKNPSRVTVVVDPVGSAIAENQLHVISQDNQNLTERELRQRWKEIQQSLSAQGLEVGEYEMVGAGDRPASQSRKQRVIRERSSYHNTAQK